VIVFLSMRFIPGSTVDLMMTDIQTEAGLAQADITRGYLGAWVTSIKLSRRREALEDVEAPTLGGEG